MSLANLSEDPLEFNESSSDVTGPLITLFVPLLMFGTGVLGNVVALALLWRSRRDHSRSVFYRLVAGLALTDLLGTLATSPVTLLVYSNDRQWVGGQPTCDYFSFMMIFAGLATVLVVGCMAIERFLAILHPYTYERHVRPERANCTLVVVWIVAAFTSCLPLMKVGRNVRHWPGTWCFFDFHSDRMVDKVFAFFFASVGLVVIIATAVCNVAIMIVLLRMRRISQNIGKSREGRTLNMTSEMQMIFFLAGIILVFATCYSPLMVHIILNVTEAVSADVQWDLLAIRLASVNQILDPWVYLLFRRRLAALLYSVCKSVSPLHTLSSLKALRSPELAQDTGLKQLTSTRDGPDSPGLQTLGGSDSVRLCDSPGFRGSPHHRFSEDPQCESHITFDSCVIPFSVDGKTGATTAGNLAGMDGQFSSSGSFLLKKVSLVLPNAVTSESDRRLRKTSCENAALSLEDDAWCGNSADSKEQYPRQQCPEVVCVNHGDGFSLRTNEHFASGKTCMNYKTNTNTKRSTDSNRKRSVDSTIKHSADRGTKCTTDNRQPQIGKILNISLKIPSTIMGKRTQRKGSKDSKDSKASSSLTQDVTLTTSASWPVICRHGNQTVIRMDIEEKADVKDYLPSFKKRHSENESDCLPLLDTLHCRLEPPCSQCKLSTEQPVTYV